MKFNSKKAQIVFDGLVKQANENKAEIVKLMQECDDFATMADIAFRNTQQHYEQIQLAAMAACKVDSDERQLDAAIQNVMFESSCGSGGGENLC